MLRALPGVVLVLLLTGCTDALEEVSGPDPEPVAEALADGLAAGDLADVPVAGDGAAAAEKELAGIVEGMGELTPSVSVAEVTETDGTATATLGWSWPVSEQEWSYTSEASLTLVGDAWQVEWEPAVVEPSLRPDGTLELTGVTAERG